MHFCTIKPKQGIRNMNALPGETEFHSLAALPACGPDPLAILAQPCSPFPLGFPEAERLGILSDSGGSGDRPLGDAHAAVKPRPPSCPTADQSHLVTNGPFGYSRNPIYLANMVLLAGMGFFRSNGWFVLLAPVDGVLTHLLAIRREESHLIALFGYEYEAYCRKVRRWI
jgi:hypothetical protein